jgi:hypothetical protein
MKFSALLRLPSAYLPITMSLVALAMVLFSVSSGATAPGVPGTGSDEGAAAHVFQLLMVAQLPVIVFFAFRWLRTSIRPAMQILLVQVAAAMAALVPVFLLHL